jgi:DNA-binding NtrC family response regulator
VVLEVPPLRDHLEDVPLLVSHFAAQSGASVAFDASAVAGLAAWRWPGNVRELQSTVLRAVTLGQRPFPDEQRLPTPTDFSEARERAVNAFERSYLEALLIKHRGSTSAVEREAGLARSYLYRLLTAHGLVPKNYR